MALYRGMVSQRRLKDAYLRISSLEGQDRRTYLERIESQYEDESDGWQDDKFGLLAVTKLDPEKRPKAPDLNKFKEKLQIRFKP